MLVAPPDPTEPVNGSTQALLLGFPVRLGWQEKPRAAGVIAREKRKTSERKTESRPSVVLTLMGAQLRPPALDLLNKRMGQLRLSKRCFSASPLDAILVIVCLKEGAE